MSSKFRWLAVAGLIFSLGTVGYTIGDEPTQIDVLKIERDRMATKFGSKHPTVIQIDQQLAMLEAQAKTQSPKNQPKFDLEAIEKMDEAQLRKVIAALVQRVETLEKDVLGLKQNQARAEMLSK